MATTGRHRRKFLHQVGGGIAAVTALGIGAGTADAQSDRTTAGVGYHLLAVGAQNDGVPVPVQVEVAPGDGAVFVNIAEVGFAADMESAVRGAVSRARTRTGVDGVDVSISFQVDTDTLVNLDGESGESALTVAVTAALRGTGPDSGTLVTGSVGDDGSLGQVGGIVPKARAARRLGADRLLVPPGQSVAVSGIEVVPVASVAAVLARTVGE